MQEWHKSWLGAHPERSEAWLRDRLKDGFDVHHLDGDKGNNDPKNLVLIEASDHMALHGGRVLRRLGPGGNLGPRKPYRPRRPNNEAAWREYFRRQGQIWQ